MTRYLFVTTIDSDGGGSELLWMTVAEKLLKGGHDVAVYLPYHKRTNELRALNDKGIMLYDGTPPPRRLGKRLIERMKNIHYSFENCIRSFAPNHIILSMSNHIQNSFFFQNYPKINIPFSLIIQLAMPIYISQSIREYFRSLYLLAENTFFVSDQNLFFTEVDLGIKLSTARVVGNEFRKEAAIAYPEKAVPSFAVPSRLDYYQKGQDLIIGAVCDPSLADSTFEINFYCDDSNTHIHDYLNALKITKIKIKPYSTLGAIWKENHALLMSSRFEGMSLALLEAMWVKRPVFTTDVGGVKSIVENSVNGIYRDCNSIDGMVTLIHEALDCFENWKEMGEFAHQAVRSQYNVSASSHVCSILTHYSQ